MTKSSPKMPRSELSLAQRPLRGVLLVGGGVPRHAPKRNRGAAGMRAAQFAFSLGREEQLAARLRLLEGFVGRTEVADCAQYALQWLGDAAGVSQAICLVKPIGGQTLTAVAAYGFPGLVVTSFAVPVDEWGNPLIAALNTRKHAFFPGAHSAADRRRRPSTPFEDAAFHALPIGASGFSVDAFGLLLIGGGASQLRPEIQWLASIFGQKLDQTLRQQALSE